MPIPDYETLMYPLLHLTSAGEITYSDAVKQLADEFSLSHEERLQLKKENDPQTLFANRVGWAKTFLGKAKLIDFPRRALMCITDRGRDALQSSQNRIDVSFLMQFPEFIEWRKVSKKKKIKENSVNDIANNTKNSVGDFISPGFEQAVTEAEMVGAFDPSNIEDARKKMLAAIVRRQGQPAFRRELLRAYGGCCTVTGCQIKEVLEASHIVPYRGPQTNHVSNGLLLRADLHTLFDLGLITIESKSKEVIVSSALSGTEYEQWHCKKIRLPKLSADHPSEESLRLHRKETFV